MCDLVKCSACALCPACLTKHDMTPSFFLYMGNPMGQMCQGTGLSTKPVLGFTGKMFVTMYDYESRVHMCYVLFDLFWCF